MAYTYRSSTSVGNSSGGSLAVTKPASTANGDLLIITAYLESDTNTWKAGSVGGFTQALKTNNTGAFGITTYYKWASGEAASWAFAPTTNGWRAVVCSAYSGGTSGASPINVSGSAQGDGQLTTTQTAPSVTTTVNNDLLIFSYGNFSGTDPTSLTGAASSLRVTLGGTLIGSATIAAASATGTTRPTDANTQDYAAAHVAFLLDSGGGASYNETGAGIAGGVSAGKDTKAAQELGVGIAGGVAAGADARAATDSGAGISGGVASGADRLSWTDTGAGIAGGVAAGADRFAWVETAAGVAGGISSGAESVTATDSGYGLAGAEAYGAERLSWTDMGAGIAGAEAYGTDVAALVDSGYGLADAITSGADTYTPAGGASYNETGAGIAGGDAYAVDVAALIDSGYSIAGLVPSGADALAYIETGAGIVGSDESGNDNYTGNDYGAGIIGSIASALDVAAILDGGYGLVGAVASVSDSLTTGGTASKTDYTRQSGQDVAQAQPDARAQGQQTAQNQNAARARGSKVA